MKTLRNRLGSGLLVSTPRKVGFGNFPGILLLALAITQLARSSEALKIAPARAFPDYQKIGLVVTPNTGPHIHPIFDLGDINKDGRPDMVMFEMDGPDASSDPVHSLAAVYL